MKRGSEEVLDSMQTLLNSAGESVFRDPAFLHPVPVKDSVLGDLGLKKKFQTTSVVFPFLPSHLTASILPFRFLPSVLTQTFT